MQYEQSDSFTRNDEILDKLSMEYSMDQNRTLSFSPDLKHKLHQLERLMEINLTITSTLDLDHVLDLIIAKAVEMLECEAGSILLYNKEKGYLSFAASTSADHQTLMDIPIPLAGSLAGEIFTKNTPLVVNNVEKDPRHDTLVGKQMNFKTKSLLGVPMQIQDRMTGVLEALNKKGGYFTASDSEILAAIACQAAVAIENAQLVHALQEAYDSTLEGWATALDLRDKETEGHSRRVTDLTIRLAHEIGVEKEISYFRQGALLHDIGKMGIPDSILQKTGPLSDEERQTMHQHPQYAYNMLAPIAYLRPALDIPYCHHEKWDGSGYPRGLKGEEIPLAARIFSIVDVWDALRTDRYYRKAWPKRRAIAYIRKESGKFFDPKIVECFLRVIQ
jgi:putative nucleotidyltransferase with HDIG domain